MVSGVLYYNNLLRQLLQNFILQDVDGYICPEDMRGLVKLFLPDKLYKDDDYMRDLIERMDRNNDGMIAYEEFVQTLKETGDPDFFRLFLLIKH